MIGPVPYKVGDRIRGKEDCYARSIYLVVGMDHEGVHLHFESLDGFCISSVANAKPRKRLLTWERPTSNEYNWGPLEGALDFRHATEQEIRRSREESTKL